MEIAERKQSLYEIDQSLALALSEREEVTEPEEIAALDAIIKDYTQQHLRKVDGIRGYILDAKNKVKAATEEAARATAFARVIQSRIDRLEGYVLAEMQV